jgi:diguanylate cyclase (GGDEF)-like protein
MPARHASQGRRRTTRARARRRRPLAPRLALLILVTCAVVAAFTRGEAAWLCVPVSLGCAAIIRQGQRRIERERDDLRRDALSDPLTGVANRRSLLIRADYELARHRRAQQSFALVMLDLDGFKQLNDRFGHAAGDDLLRDVAGALRRAMRGQDTVARFGGDEFCVLAPETDQRGTERLAAKVMQAVRDVSVGMEAVAGSVGVAVFPEDGSSALELMHVADERLLAAKRRRPQGADRAPRRAA